MDNVLECLRSRGLVDSVAGESIEEKLAVPTKVYMGFDPTADSLHLGNLVGIVVLAWCQRYGHTPVILLGGATGKIGDPSGKSKERPLLDDQVLHKNIDGIAKNFAGVLDMTGKLPMPLFVNNDDWIAPFSLIDFLRDVGKYFRVGPMLAKESVRARIHSEEGMSYTEFSYMLLQAYDFYHLFTKEGVSVQMGGSDQWGNITAGIELTRKLTGQSVYGLTFPLLTRSDGKKFGKSESGAIWLSPEKVSPYQFYQYFIGISDEDVISMMKKLTFMDLKDIAIYEENMRKKGYIPNTAQKKLAEEMTKMVHGQEGLDSALRITKTMMPGSLAELTEDAVRELLLDMPVLHFTREQVVHVKFADVAVLCGLVTSKGEANRLVHNLGAYVNHRRIVDVQDVIGEEDCIGGKYIVLGSGKKKKIVIQIA